MCRETFASFENGKGRVDVWNLRTILESIGGNKPSDDILYAMVAGIDEDMAGDLDFDSFLRVCEQQKRRLSAEVEDDSDLCEYCSIRGASYVDERGFVVRFPSAHEVF